MQEEEKHENDQKKWYRKGKEIQEQQQVGYNGRSRNCLRRRKRSAESTITTTMATILIGRRKCWSSKMKARKKC